MSTLDIVLPVFNEQRVLESSVRTLRDFLETVMTNDWLITIADNGSTDETFAIAQRLESELPRVRALHISEAGRGRALSRAWLASDADVLAYVDIDLSTDLAYFPRLAQMIETGEADIASGSRLGRGARTERTLKREVLSRGFVFLINRLFGTRLRDTQCGFKAINCTAARRLLPLLEDTGWFWDTELLLLAEKGGWRVGFVPVRWLEDSDSRVQIVKTVWRDLMGLQRMHRFDWARAQKTVRLDRSEMPGRDAAQGQVR